MQIKDLKPNVRNPRKISKERLDSLKASMLKFGDLSGFVYNRTTKRLFGGHQKQKVSAEDSQVKITQKYDVPTAAKTVAEGYVLIEGEKFKYREVEADETWEMEAMIAANAHGGEWDKDLLKLNFADFKGIDLGLTGLTPIDLKEMDIKIDVNPISLKIDDKPKSRQEPQEESDEDYVKNTPQTSERIPTESPNMNVVAETKEKAMDVVGKRFVIIIDCNSAEHKSALKEKIATVVKDAGGKFF